MSNDKTKLSPYTLKLSQQDKQSIKLICAVDSSFRYQYDLFDAAVAWAFDNRDNLVAIANPRQGDYSSYYVCEGVDQLKDLEDAWNCNGTRALYTALVNYLKHRSVDLKMVAEAAN